MRPTASDYLDEPTDSGVGAVEGARAIWTALPARMINRRQDMDGLSLAQSRSHGQ